MEYFDIAYKILSLLIGAGILGGIGKLVVWAVTIGPRIQNIEKQSESQGQMIQQFTAALAHVEGVIEGLSKPQLKPVSDKE